MTYPALILAYLGQGARLIEDGDKVITNAFYRSIPGPVDGPLYWIVFVFGILATVRPQTLCLDSDESDIYFPSLSPPRQ